MWFYTRMTYRELPIHQGGEKRTNQIPRIWLAVVSKPIEISCQFKRHWIPMWFYTRMTYRELPIHQGGEKRTNQIPRIWLAVVSKPIEISLSIQTALDSPCDSTQEWPIGNSIGNSQYTKGEKKRTTIKSLAFDWIPLVILHKNGLSEQPNTRSKKEERQLEHCSF